MNKIELNINQMVKVKLSKEAKERKQKEIDEYNKKFKENYKMPIDKDGYYEDQLWSIMSDFGDMLGSEISPIEDCKLIIEW